MRKKIERIALFIALFIALLVTTGCNSTFKEEEFIGIWINEKENCKIQFNQGFIFKSTNIPLDVVNEYYLNSNKEINTWNGKWLLKNKQSS